MPRPRQRVLVDTFCINCLLPLKRTLTKRDRAFCSQSCYFQWLREKRPASEIYYRHQEGQLLAELQHVANLLGHLPSVTEMRQHSSIDPSTFRNRFGSWRMALVCITNPAPSITWDITQVTSEDGSWLAGLADGESTFRLAKHRTSFSPIWGFQLRADDLPVLEEIKRILGVKAPLDFWHREHDRARGINAGDAIRFYIRDIPTAYNRVIPLFRRFPLRSKKQKDFQLYAEAVDLLNQHRQDLQHRKYPDRLKERLAELKWLLEQVKKYVPPAESC